MRSINFELITNLYASSQMHNKEKKLLSKPVDH
jgi:hypothetical protein